jgi:hypothetical protein
MITVTTTTGTEQVAGTDLDVDQGILTVVDDSGTTLAMFAPGVWQSAIVVPS